MSLVRVHNFAISLDGFGARDEPAWKSAAATLTARVPVRVRLLDPMAARALGATGRSALLVRSDGTPVGVLPAGADPVPSLRAAVAAVGGYATSLTLLRAQTPLAASA